MQVCRATAESRFAHYGDPRRFLRTTSVSRWPAPDDIRRVSGLLRPRRRLRADRWRLGGAENGPTRTRKAVWLVVHGVRSLDQVEVLWNPAWVTLRCEDFRLSRTIAGSILCSHRPPGHCSGEGYIWSAGPGDRDSFALGSSVGYHCARNGLQRNRRKRDRVHRPAEA